MALLVAAGTPAAATAGTPVAAAVAPASVSAPARSAGPGPIVNDQFRTASCSGTPACMTGVSCPTKTMCLAVGVAEHSMLAERWNGRRWIHQRPPGSGGLTAVSCTSATACTAVGFGEKGGTLAERWNGHKWSIQPTPFPGGEAIPFQGVSCSSARACTAAGEWGYDPATSAENTLAEHWNGTSWKVQPSPMGGPAGGADLTAVSCTSATACTAVGYGFLANGDEGFTGGGLILRWNGTKWAGQSVPLPFNDEFSLLTGVSCPALRTCMAVGFGDESGSLAVRWNGSKWARSKIGGLQQMQAVSCSSARACTAVGGNPDVQPSGGVARHWNGTKWARESVARSKTSVLMGVSCSSATRCTAVGFRRLGKGFHIALLAQRWNGHTWRVQFLPSS